MSAHPREPFDAEEARLKRAYDALPQGEPSAALDARILAHARAAATQGPKRRRPWFLGAGLGTAAAAVFAAGIAWQLGVFKGDRNLSSAPMEAPAAQEELDRIDIEFMKQERKQDEDEDAAKSRVAPAPQPVAVPAAQSAAAPPPPPAAPPSALRDAAPAARAEAPAVAEQRQRENVPANEAVPAKPQPFPAEAAQAPVAADESRDLAASTREDAFEGETAATAAPEIAADAAESADPALGAATSGAAAPAAGRRAAGFAKEAPLPPWAEDVKLAPDAWLERIRDRVQRGDRQGAEHSLRRLVLEHPRQRVPRDLQRLLVE